MKINHVISSLSASSGGPARSVPLLCSALAEYADIGISTIQSNDEVTVCDAISVYSFDKSYTNLPIGCSVGLNEHLRKTDCDVINAHGLWLMSSHYAVNSASKLNLPVVISPRGMLEPGALQFSKWKKKISGWLWQNKDLHKATCIHVTSQMEADNCRRYGLKKPIAIVPNGINLDGYPLKYNLRNTEQKRTLLFLSRIHPKKGLIYLLEAWAQLKKFHDDWQLVIAGNDDGGHEAELKQVASRLNLLWADTTTEIIESNISIFFAGPLFGSAKVNAYQDADLFVLPTLSENFGMVIPEALACGTPVITTKGAPWHELSITDSGWWIDIGVEPLIECLQEALATSNADLYLKGLRGRRLVEENYSIDSIARQMMLVYEWLVNGRQAPSSVRFD